MKYALAMIVCSFALANGAGAQQLLTLEDAVRLARENNFAIRIAENEARIAANDYSIGNAGFLPSLNLSARQSRSSFGNVTGDQAVFGTAHTVDLAVNAGATIFDGGGRLATYRRLGSEMEQRELEADLTSESVLADVVTSYYDLVRLQEQIGVQQEAVEISEERLRIAGLRRDLGSGSELDVRRAQVDLNADRAALLRRQVDLANARAAFNILIDLESSAEYHVADTIRIDASLTLDALRPAALQRNGALAVARQAQMTAGFAHAEARADWLPRIDLTAGYYFNNLTADLGLPSGRPPGLNYGVSATWNIFDGFNRARRLQNAGLRIENSDLILEEVRHEVTTRLETVYQNYRNSLELVDLERENISIAEFNVEIALQQFRLGTITSVELREVQSAFTSAMLRLITAQFEAVRAQTELLRLSGTLLDRTGREQ